MRTNHVLTKVWLGVGVAAVAAVVATVASGASGVWTITTFAGSGMHGGGFAGDGGPATRARLYSPRGVAVDRKGNVYIADTTNSRIRKVSPGGKIQTIAGNGKSRGADALGDGGPATSAPLSIPRAVAVDARGNVYIVEGSHVRRVDPSGTITTFAGGMCCAQGDGGPAT